MSGLRRVYWVRVAGVGNGGTAYLWTTGAMSAGPDSEIVIEGALLEPVGSPASSIRVLDTLGADSSIDVRLRYGAPGVAYLTQRQRTVAAAAGAAARLMHYIDHTSTELVLDDTSGITAGDTVYIQREAMFVDSVDSATTLKVVRGVMGTVATPHAMPPLQLAPWGTPEYRPPGPRVYTSPPPPIGAWLSAGYSDISGVTVTAEVVTWRGMVDDISIESGLAVRVRGRSLLSVARDHTALDAEAVCPWGRTYGVARYDAGWTYTGTGVRLATVAYPFVYFDTDVFGTDRSPGYVRLTATDGRWIVLRAESVTPIGLNVVSIGGKLYAVEVGVPTEIYRTTPIQLGDADGLLVFDDAGAIDGGYPEDTDRDRHILDVLSDPNGVWSWAVVTLASLSAVVTQALAIGDTAAPAGWSDLYPADWIDLRFLGSALVGSVYANVEPTASSVWCWLPVGTDRTLERLSTDLLGPAACALAHDRGDVRAIDWLQRDDAVAATITGASSRNRAYSWRVDSIGAAAAAILTGRGLGVDGGTVTEFVASDRVDPLAPGETTINVPLRAYRRPADLVYRWAGVVLRYAVPLPSVGLVSSVAMRIGDSVTLTRPDLPSADGSGAVEYNGIVVGHGVRVDGDHDYAIVVTGWHEYEAGHRWAPSARVVSSTGAGPRTVTFSSAVYSSGDDAALFAAAGFPVSCQLLTAAGAFIDDCVATGWPAANQLAITGLASAPTAGDVLVLGNSSTPDTAQAARWVWLADDDGLVTDLEPTNWGH